VKPFENERRRAVLTISPSPRKVRQKGELWCGAAEFVSLMPLAAQYSENTKAPGQPKYPSSGGHKISGKRRSHEAIWSG
jgi:hypothetical protein